MFRTAKLVIRSNIRHYAEKGPPDPPKPGSRKVFKIYRFDGILSKTEPRIQSYDLDTNQCGSMVLDVLQTIKEMDPSLTFRRSCREGICGSCAICLQGRNCLACTTEIPAAKVITIHPLPHMYIIRDLVVDLTHFMRAYNSVRPYLVRHKSFPLGLKQFAQGQSDNDKLIGLYECILCGCCSTSCPSYWWNGRRFLGPCALLHAYKWVIDSRDEDTQKRLSDLRDDFKAFRCHTIMNCTLQCPKGLHPAFAISRLKKLISGVDKKPLSEIDPLKYMSGAGGSGGLDACIEKMKKGK